MQQSKEAQAVESGEQVKLVNIATRLKSEAYAGSGEAETIGRAVLANQFLAGLHPELKDKLVGQEVVS